MYKLGVNILASQHGVSTNHNKIRQEFRSFFVERMKAWRQNLRSVAIRPRRVDEAKFHGQEDEEYESSNDEEALKNLETGLETLRKDYIIHRVCITQYEKFDMEANVKRFRNENLMKHLKGTSVVTSP
jgi:hypothetical protein